MIKKLHRKFVAISMAALLLVLTIIMGTINILNYRNIVQDADSILQLLAENDGRFPTGDMGDRGDMEPPQNEAMTGGGNFGKFGGLNHMSAELPYESRFYSVLITEDGNITAVDTGKIAAIDTEAAMEYAMQIWNSKRTSGFVDDYRYLVNQVEDGGTRIIFLDCTRNLSTYRNFLFTSIAIALMGMIAVFLMIVLLSRWIIRPVSESYEKQKRFITDAGHELKTPLTIIDADAEILAMELGENEWISDIQRQTGRLATLTNDLVYLSKMEEENSLQMIEFPISDVVAETAEDFRMVAKSGEKGFETNIQPMLALKGDEKSIRQLTSILLDNAVKYTQPGGQIDLHLWKQGKALSLEITNTSENVQQEDLAHLFDRFYRADASRNSQTGGHGIGLSIARAIVIAHKGKITATMKEPGKLTITATFPGA